MAFLAVQRAEVEHGVGAVVLERRAVVGPGGLELVVEEPEVVALALAVDAAGPLLLGLVPCDAQESGLYGRGRAGRAGRAVAGGVVIGAEATVVGGGVRALPYRHRGGRRCDAGGGCECCRGMQI